MRVAKVIAKDNERLNVRFECEHCGYMFIGTGVDDKYFHSIVVPGLSCESCGRTAGRQDRGGRDDS